MAVVVFDRVELELARGKVEIKLVLFCLLGSGRFGAVHLKSYQFHLNFYLEMK